jgi:hypothetical protein
MKRWEILWLAFEKFAIFFSFAVTFVVVIALLVLGFALFQQRESLLGLKDGIVCDTVTGLNTLLDDFEDAVITRTISITDSIPVVFDLPLDQNISVRMTQGVDLQRPTTMVLPGGGGRINGTVYLQLPQGLRLPIELKTTVPVRQEVPVVMDVPVSIPLKETDLGGVIQQLRDLLKPLQLEKLEETLQCPGR